MGELLWALLLPFLWAAGAGAVGIAVALLLTFASDGGLPDERWQTRAFAVCLLGIGLAGVAGVPFGIASYQGESGGAMRRIGIAVLAAGGAIALTGLLSYLIPFAVARRRPAVPPSPPEPAERS